MSEELKACPFCGGEAMTPYSLFGEMHTRCPKCPDATMALATWNRRTVEESLRAEVERLRGEAYHDLPSDDHPTGTLWKDVCQWNAASFEENQKALAEIAARVGELEKELADVRAELEGADQIIDALNSEVK